MEFLEHGKRKPIVKVKNLSNLEQMIRNGGIQKNLKLGIHLYSIPFVPRLGFFPIHSSRKMRHVIHGGSKVCFETRFKVAEFYPPTFVFPYARDFELHLYPRREISM
ncbi:hypothetical protein AVEN_264653-1 [Araneus ventricosus]|uniref:Uncharacterized protein n=1 Tax=Araneus ventricosus TaxID=182803 RepID=A0A4Y2RHC8_ARAVE|nr:hypothetical protein AVEN_264653-1 [Araneus ventricosus]